MTARRRAVSPLLLWGCLVWMGLPGVGLAAQDVPPSEAPVELSAPGAGDTGDVAEEEDWARPERYRAPVGVRLLTEVGTGLLTSTVGGAALGLAGFGLCSATGFLKDGFFECYAPLFLFGLLGLVEGYGLGVWWGGELVGGDGQLLFSLVGATAGVLGSIFVGYVVSTQHGQELSFLVAVPVALGGHLGYELSQRAETSSGRAARPSLQPMLGLSSRGALLGLGGHF